MAGEESTTITIQEPLIQVIQAQEQSEHSVSGIVDDTHLDKSLHRLDFLLSFLGFHQTSVFSSGLSWIAFLVVGIALPVVILKLGNCSASACEKYQVEDFEYDVLASQASLGVASLLCLSYNLRSYGIRKFLFVDRYSGHVVRFMDQYIHKIRNSYCQLVFWLLPCLILKTAREIVRLSNVNEGWWQSAGISLALIISWTYVNSINLAACILFQLVCNLQVIHFEDYGKLLERESNIFDLMEKHIRLRNYLSEISHRFRIYLVLLFLIVTASQFVTLMQTTGYDGTITLINGGDFVVNSVIQVVGITLCLHAATKISHKAQAIASVAAKWHAFVTCSLEGMQSRRRLLSFGSLGSANNYSSRLRYNYYSESDLESLDSMTLPAELRLASSFVSSYHMRQSFVLYLQTNPGGITIFGWTVDRAFISTIFFLELSLVLFVLGQTIVLSPNPILP
ncbi:hypothetical protein Dimus_015229 [Dionaea muscipula]